jgi:hypothetical protein
LEIYEKRPRSPVRPKSTDEFRIAFQKGKPDEHESSIYQPLFRRYHDGFKDNDLCGTHSWKTLEALEMPSAWALKVLATDNSTRILKTVKSGIYAQERVQSIPPALIKKFFLRGDHLWQGFVKVKDEVKQYTSFTLLNLMEPFSFQEPFDCIFCRNVMIYFDKKTQTSLVSRFFDNLAKGGFL